MFTGLVSAVGRLSSLQDGRLRVTFDPAWTEGDPLVAGESVAVNGCCLTVVDWGSDWADFELSEETFRRTTFSEVPNSSPCLQGEVEVVEVFPSPGSQEKVPCDSKGDEVDKTPSVSLRLTPPPPASRQVEELDASPNLLPLRSRGRWRAKRDGGGS